MNKKPPQKKYIANHFETEAKIMAGCFPVILLIGLLAGLLGPRVKHFLIVDSCLDSGGSFNYNTQRCENSRGNEQKK